MTLVAGSPVPTFEVAFRAPQTLREASVGTAAHRGDTERATAARHGLNLHAPSCESSVGDTDRWFLCSGSKNVAVDCLPIKAQVLPSDSTPGSMSEGVSGESRADDLVSCVGRRVCWAARPSGLQRAVRRAE